MQLLAPMMLLGATAVTVPIALHFFYRARYKPLPWAPMKFIKEAVEQTSRRLKFQEWVLLALRCLALILLAVAIARPGRESTASTGAETIDAVFVFDTSYSMAARDGERTRLERAKEAALAVLETLPNKSSVQIYACADRASLLGPVSRYNRDQARQVIQSVEVTSLSTDVLPGLTDALTAAESGTAPAKEIYVFSDMQKSGFERQQGAVRAKCEEIKARANLVFIRCGNPERKVSNVSITDVKLLAAIPHTRTRVPFVVTVRNTGREPVRGVKVALELDGKAVERDVVQIEHIDPGTNAEVTLTGSLDEAGARLLAVFVDGDGVEGDNVLYKIVGVRDKVRVLLVAYPFAGQPATDAGDWFVRKALVPFDPDRDKDKIERYFIETESALPQEVSPEKLAGKDIVYLLNAAARTDDPLSGLSPAFVTKLTEFVRAGGGLVIGCGDLVQAGAYNRVLGSAGAGLLPFPLRDARDTPDATPFVPAAESIDAASVFGQVKPYTDWLRRATATRMFDLDESAPNGGRVLMRTTQGAPLVASRVVGEGEVIFFATSLDETWGRVMSDGQLAVPMTTYIVSHLTGRKVPGGTRTAGDTLSWTPPMIAPGFELVKPRPRGAKASDKVRPRVKLAEPRSEVGQKLTVSTADALVAGEYAIVPVGAPETDGVTFAVNPDLRETENLDAISDGELEKLLGFRPAIITAGAGTETAVRERRTRGEWTHWFLLGLLVLLVGEATWAWFCGKTW
ncbi:hypothetical protein VT84_31590 [Gemmata sp. SH-PL17]|uniref:BatA domain-containing protein n=1 Tax=Gemmata sp. SH-PL17 TaxID=1630693 RepID=UPI00078BAED5|nr:BatA domain-containing protein [Gemmata sp. SH-PL17]AMV28980.1 hypothetical protein VT84_31590 [Gemmata sp. SH-PL17]